MAPARQRDWVVPALRAPAELPAWPALRWDLLVRQARRPDLLPRVAHAVRRAGVLEQVPPGPRAHLQAALVVDEAQNRDILREVRYIAQALDAAGVPAVLLKGAAYVAAGLQAGIGRAMSDIDVLVPREALGAVEASLMQHGWATTHHSAYDQRYYRQWMHELPPLRHIRRMTAIDVHHALLPVTARLRPDSRLLLADARPVDGWPGVQVLSPVDMALHCMAHLFMNEELSHGLRDLSDLDLLLREFGTDPSFWGALPGRSEQLELQRPLHYGLLFARQVFGTPVPAAAAEAAARHAPPAALRPLMHALWRRGVASTHPTARLPGTGPALFALYVRAHWLRMPPLLLTRHLLRKAFVSDAP